MINPESPEYNDWHYAMLMAETQYMNLRKAGIKPEIARGVLPNDTKTELVVTATETEWQHIINLRYIGITGTPHPQIKELIGMALPMLQKESNNRIKGGN
jgi:thymidylate synthase (FAD)